MKGSPRDGVSVNNLDTLRAEFGQDIHVLSSELMFRGDYSRDGDDLVISHGGNELILVGYFGIENPGNLVAPNGAFLDFETVSAMAGPASPGQYAQAVTVASGSARIGTVIKLTGEATNKHTDGVEVQLSIGSPVFQGDVVSTGPDSTLGISFTDESVFSMSANSKMVLNELIYDPQKAEDSSMVFNLVQGTFVFVAGKVAPNGQMNIETPVATMGIRGTTPKVVVDTNLGVGEFTVLPDPDSGKVGSYILIDKSTGKIIGTVESTGSKWVVTSLSNDAVEIGKTGIDLLEDQVALDQIREAFSSATGDRTQIDGTNSFGQVAFNANSGSEGGADNLGGGDGDGIQSNRTGGDGDTGDKDDPPIAADDEFAIDEDTLLTGANLIADNGNGPDIDPDGFALDVSAINGTPLTFVGGLASGLLPSGAILVINPAGDITYDPYDVFDFLGLNDQDTDTFTYTINDPNDFTDIGTVTITLTGRNDTPEFTDLPTTILTGSFTEQASTGDTATTRTSNGNVTFTDIDASDTHDESSSVVSVTWNRNDTGPQSIAEVGSISLALTESAANPAPMLQFDATGALISTPDPVTGDVAWLYSVTESDLDFLAQNETLELIYAITVTDDSGVGAGGGTNEPASATRNVTVTISGTNDTPVITPNIVIGTVSDVDEAANVPPQNNAGDRTAAGSISFADADLTDRPTATEATVSVTWFAQDGSTELTLSAAQLAAIEAAFSISPDASSGSNTNNGTIDWNYTIAEGDLDFLGAGEQVIAKFKITVTDDFGASDEQEITLTLLGADDDAPVISPVTVSGTVADVAEASTIPPSADDGQISATGSITFADVDETDRPVATEVTKSVTGLADDGSTPLALTAGQQAAIEAAFDISPKGVPGTNTNQGTINWTYDIAEANLDFLGFGETVTATFTITVTDDEGNTDTQDVTITINGANDAPWITAQTNVSETLTETEGSLSTTGNFGVADVDITDTVTIKEVTLATGGTDSGVTAPTNTQLLAMFSPQSGAEIDATQTSGTVNWTFDAGTDAFDYLGATESLLLTYTVTLTDDNGSEVTQDVTITITGTNDNPVVAATDVTGAVTELVTPTGNLTDTGTIAFSDVDLTDVHIIDPTITASAGALGTLTASVTTDTTGSGTGGVITWNYSVAAADVEFLAKDQTKVETFTLTLDDQNGGTIDRIVTVTITGTNDDPVVAATDVSGAVTELVTPTGNLTDTGTIAFSDVDLTDVHIIDPTITPSVGALGTLTASVTTDTTGSGTGGLINWNYSVAAADVEFLAKDQTKVETFTLTLDDQNGGTIDRTVTVTITGTNDNPIAVNDTNGTDELIEAGVTPGNTPFPGDDMAIGNVLANDTDVDIADSKSVVGVNAGNVSGPLSSNVGSDVIGTYGKLVLNANGTWTYTLDNSDPDTQGLADQEAATDVFTYTMSDGPGATSTATLTIDITGTNDAPIASPDQTVTDEETPSSGNLFVVNNGSADSDPDGDTFQVFSIDGQSADVGQTITLSSGATVQIDANGDYQFDPNGAFDFVRQGASSADGVDYVLIDQNGALSDPARANFGVTGINDTPVVTGATNPAAIAEATNASAQDIGGVTGTLSVEDADLGDTLSGSVIGDGVAQLNGGPVPAAHDVSALIAASAVSFNSVTSDGGNKTLTWTYDPTATDLDWLAENDTLTITFTAQANDGFGNVGAEPITITISGTNDIPVAQSDSATIFESADAFFNVLTNDGDVDATDFLTVTEITGSPLGSYFVTSAGGRTGSFTLESDGQATFETLGNFDDLNSGDTDTVTLNYTVEDNNGGSSTSSIQINVNGIDGVNSDPVISQILGSWALDNTLDQSGNSRDLTLNGASQPTFGTGLIGDGIQLDGSFGSSATVNSNNAVFDFGANEFTLQVWVNLNDWNYASHNPGTGHPYGEQVLVEKLDGNGAPGLPGWTLTYFGNSIVFGGNLDTGTPFGFQAATDPNAAIGQWQQFVVTRTDSTFKIYQNGVEIGSFTNSGTIGASVNPLHIGTRNGGDTRNFTVDGTIDNVVILDRPWTATEVSDAWNGGAGIAPPAPPETSVTEITDGAPGEGTTVSILSGEIYFTDAESADTHTISTSPQSAGYKGNFSAVLTTDSTGIESGRIDWTFSVSDADLDDLSEGEVVSQTYTIRIEDQFGGNVEEDVTITFTGTNDLPIVTAGATLNYQHNSGSQIIDNTITVNDPDNADLIGATVAITGNFQSSGDFLGFVNQNGISGAYNSATGELTLTGLATVAEYEAALRSVTFNNNSSAPDTLDREISFSVNDGIGDSAIATSTVTLPNYTTTPGANGNGNVLVGDGDDNILNGLAGDDDLNGGDGNDIIIGGEGQDLLTGGAGKDMFVMQASTDGNLEVDDILDFDILNDAINLSELLSGSFDPNTPENEITFDQPGTGSDILISVNGQDVATLGGVSFGDTISVIHDEAQAAIAVQVMMGIA